MFLIKWTVYTSGVPFFYELKQIPGNYVLWINLRTTSKSPIYIEQAIFSALLRLKRWNETYRKVPALLQQPYYASFCAFYESYLSWLLLPALHSSFYRWPHSYGQGPAVRQTQTKIDRWSESTTRFKPCITEINNQRGTIYWSERWIRRLNSKGLFHLLAADRAAATHRMRKEKKQGKKNQ